MSDSMISRFAQNPNPGGLFSGVTNAKDARADIFSLADAVSANDYGAVDDEQKGYFTCTWTSGGVTVTASTATMSLTIQNTGTYNGSTVAQLTLPGLAATSGLADFESWVGKPIAISGAGVAGGIFVARVVAFDYTFPANVAIFTLSRACETPLTASSRQFMIPCFTGPNDPSGLPSCVGKKMVASDGIIGGANYVGPRGYYNNYTTIATYVSPYVVTVSDTFTVARTAAVAKLRWFTDNFQAILAAGFAAKNSGQRKLAFVGFTQLGSTGVFGAIISSVNGFPNADQLAFHRYLSQLRFVTSGPDVETDFMTYTDRVGQTGWCDVEFIAQAIPWNAPAYQLPYDEVGGEGAFPCCAGITNIPVVFAGDSWFVEDPTGSGNACYTVIYRWLQRKNKAKVIAGVTRGIGATRWRNLASLAGSGLTGIPPWSAGGAATNWLSGFILSIPSPFGGGNVSPALVVIGLGDNDGINFIVNDMWMAINRLRTPIAYGGKPVDLLVISEGAKGVEYWNNFSMEASNLNKEFATTYLRSACRTSNIGMIDWADLSMKSVHGWTPARPLRRQVPGLPQGNATATVPYVFPSAYKCRSYRVVLKLGAGTGSAFWAAIKTLEISLSNKPDNRLVLTTNVGITGDAGGNLYCYWRSWGGIISTPCTLANGTAVLTTSGQTNIGGTSNQMFNTGAPDHRLASQTSGVWTVGMLGTCVFAAGVAYQSADYRAILHTFQASTVVGATEPNDQNTLAAGGIYQGGWMFTVKDQYAAANVRITDSGNNILRTTVLTYTNFQQVTLAANWTFTSLAATTVDLEVGRFSAPAAHVKVPQGTNVSANGCYVIVEVDDTRARVSVLNGDAAGYNVDLRKFQQDAEWLIWEGDVERFGGPFIPMIWATGGTATITPAWVEIDEKKQNYVMPAMTTREAFGPADSVFVNPISGDSGHPTRLFIKNVMEPALAIQSLNMI